MLTERDRAHLEVTATRDLKAQRKALVEEREETYNLKRCQWIDARVAFIDDLLAARNKPSL